MVDLLITFLMTMPFCTGCAVTEGLAPCRWCVHVGKCFSDYICMRAHCCNLLQYPCMHGINSTWLWSTCACGAHTMSAHVQHVLRLYLALCDNSSWACIWSLPKYRVLSDCIKTPSCVTHSLPVSFKKRVGQFYRRAAIWQLASREASLVNTLDIYL